MPKTMTFDREEIAFIRKTLLAERNKAQKALARVEAAVKTGKKNESWLRRPTEHLEMVTRLYVEAMKPVMVTRRNLMSGQEYQEAEDTPLSCSPASETYWSM